jgi:transposase
MDQTKKQLNDSLKNHVIKLYERGYSKTFIAELYQVSRKTIYNIIAKYENKNTIKREKGSGRKLDNTIFEKIKKILDQNHNLSLIQISAALQMEYNIKCPKTTVHRLLIQNNYINKKPMKKQLLTQKHLNDRENWAIFYENYDWKNVIWSDETTVSIQPETLSKIWIHKDEEYVHRTIKFPLKIHIWGCILYDHKLIIHIYDKTMNSDKYIDILKLKLLPLINSYKEKFPNNKILFQQDNATCHTTFKTCKFFGDNNIEVMFWPANSPDLNPIENIWVILKKNIGKIYVKTKDELINIIVKCVNDLEISKINNIIISMDNRINELFNNSFDYVNY